ncbi:MAG: NarK/NasA family nitrate transporter [Clostridiaceae bacterium]|jgi:nitrate/nitrite transporter NarK|nr:NarK/NasA family nitrate transporter [Clostridiaceae bacterium]
MKTLRRLPWQVKFGMISAFANVGGVLTPVLVGGSYDALGSYKPALAVMIGLLAVVTIAYLWAFGSQAKRAG